MQLGFRPCEVRFCPHVLPTGGYAVVVDGAGRTREFRGMVAGLHATGLRVVLDVVYNHTFHSGEGLISTSTKQ